uniref:Uncharacterized protein n=1 Tax=Strongyloides venezuelensis TaxID=75913 RepID=A0A0K0FBF0_STRVS
MKSFDSFYLFPLCLGKDKHNEGKEKSPYFVSPQKSATTDAIFDKQFSTTNTIITTQSENLNNSNNSNISDNMCNSKSLVNLNNYSKFKDDSILTTVKHNAKMLSKSSSIAGKSLKDSNDIISKSRSPSQTSNHYRLSTYKSINSFIAVDTIKSIITKTSSKNKRYNFSSSVEVENNKGIIATIISTFILP